METTTKQRRPNGGQFRTGPDPRRHRFTRDECVKGFWAALTSSCCQLFGREPERKKLAKEEHHKPLAYKIKKFARLTDLSERFVKQQIYDGELRAIKKGSVWLIPAEAAKAYLALKEEAQEGDQSVATAAPAHA